MKLCVFTAKQLADLPPAPVLVTVTKTSFILVGLFNHPYEIEKDRINTPEKALGWIAHLSEKVWVTNEHIRQLILALGKIKGMSIDMHA